MERAECPAFKCYHLEVLHKKCEVLTEEKERTAASAFVIINKLTKERATLKSENERLRRIEKRIPRKHCLKCDGFDVCIDARVPNQVDCLVGDWLPLDGEKEEK